MKQCVKHLRVFGSTACVHISKEERVKLDSKTMKCILLGYGNVQNGYRVFNPIAQKISYSRNVKFDERENEVVQLEEPTTQHSLVLDTTDEVESVVQEETTTPEDQSSVESQEPEPIREHQGSTRERRPVDYNGLSQQAHLVIHDNKPQGSNQ